MAELKDRFVYSTAAFHRLLCFVGINPFPECKPANIWSGFCFFLVFQASLYVYINRSIPHFHGFFELDNLIALIDRSVRLFCVSMTQMALVFKLSRLLNSFCRKLQSVDTKLNRPDLSGIRFLSITGVTSILLMVIY